MNAVQAIERFQEITDALKRGDLDNPDACMMAFLDWCEGEGFDMRWFTKITDKLPERLRRSLNTIRLALETRQHAGIWGRDLDGVRVVFGYSKYLNFEPTPGKRPMGIIVGLKHGGVAPAPPPHVKAGYLFTYVRISFERLERPYDHEVQWGTQLFSRVPLLLKNF